MDDHDYEKTKEEYDLGIICSEAEKNLQVLSEETFPNPENLPPTSSGDNEKSALQDILLQARNAAEDISSLKNIVQLRLAYDETKERLFDKLYAELEALKKNSAFEDLRPLYMDLILLFDRIEHVRRDASEASTSYPEFLKTISDEVLEILYRRDVEVIHNDNTLFDPSIQRAVAVEPTEQETENNAVVRIVRSGFRHKDRLLRPEEVIVRRFLQGSS